MATVVVAELRSLVERFAAALEANKADRAAVGGLRDLCAMFAGCDKKTVADFLKIASRASIPTGAQTRPLRSSVIPALASLRAFGNEFVKKDLNKSLDSLLSLLQANGDRSIAAVVAAVKEEVASASQPIGEKGAEAMNDSLIDDYVKRLEAALGDERRFRSLLEELLADERVAQPEAVTIASRFYGRVPKGTSRAKAFERIKERQEKLMEFKKRPSTAGRSAA
jgi:hypothetical protein